MQARRTKSAAGIALALAGLLAACGDDAGDAPAVRNVVLVSIDTLRFDHLGLHGYARPTSPFLDALAADAAVFEQAISQAPWTAPSHATMLTSLYPSVLGMGNHADPGRISSAVDTLAEVLRGAGLRTHAVVAGGYMARALGFDQGFEVYDDDAPRMRVTVDKGLDWLAGLEADERFFLFLHTYDVHLYKPPDALRDAWIRPYDGNLARHANVAELVQGNDHLDEVRALGEADRRYVVDLYDASIASVDLEMRRLVDALRDSGRLDDTLIVVTSDHGEEFWERGRTGHGYSLHDENLRVPLILAHPSIAARRVADQVRLLDVAPTIAELAGAAVPAAWQGRSLVTLLEGKRLDLPAFSEYAHIPYKSVRAHGRKLIAGFRRPRILHYDLAADPGEAHNLADGGTPEEAKMREALKAWILHCAVDERFQSGESAQLDDETMRQLDQLGYVEAAGGSGSFMPDLPKWLDVLDGTAE